MNPGNSPEHTAALSFSIFWSLLFLFLGSVPASAQLIDQSAKSPAWFSQDDFHHEQERALHAMSAEAVHADPRFEVYYYGINLDVNFDDRAFAGFADLGIRIRETTDEIELELYSGYVIDSVAVKNASFSAEFVRPQSGPEYRLIIQFSEELSVGDEPLIRIFYDGEPDVTGFSSVHFTTIGGEPHLWTLSQPYGARNWFPVRNAPDSKADSADVVVVVPENLKVGSVGLLQDVAPVGEGRSRWHWKTRYPISHYLLSITAGDYSVYDQEFSNGSDSFPIQNYIFRDNDTPSVRTQIDLTLDMMEVFTELFGPYPFADEKYGHIQFNRGGGMEHQTMSSMSNFNQNLVAHELAHHWFGNAVTCNSWEHIWLNEGFATYAEGLFVEAKDGEAAFRDWRQSFRNQVTRRPDRSVYVPSEFVDPANPFDSATRIFYYRTSYAKGGLVLHMLRRKLGDEVFFEGLRSYISGPLQFGTATTDEFRQAMEEISGIDLTAFFDQWIFGEGHPEYKITYASQPTVGDKFAFRLRIEQTPSMPELDIFDMPLEIRLQGPQADTTIVVRPDTWPWEKRFELPFPVSTPILDPDGHYIIGDIEYVPASFQSFDPDLPLQTQLFNNYPNPFNPSTIIPFQVGQPGNVRIRIFDATGRLVDTITNEFISTGFHTVQWNATGRASGVYLVEMEWAEGRQIEKIVLIR